MASTSPCESIGLEGAGWWNWVPWVHPSATGIQNAGVLVISESAAVESASKSARCSSNIEPVKRLAEPGFAGARAFAPVP